MKKRTVITSETRELWIIHQGNEEVSEVYPSAPRERSTPDFHDNHGSHGSPVTDAEHPSSATCPMNEPSITEERIKS